MSKTNFIITVAIALLTVSVWAFFNRPAVEPPWPAQIQGFSFSPMRAGQSPVTGVLPSREQIDADLALLAGKTHAVRTYGVDGPLADIPTLARKYGINVTLGAWLERDPEQNQAEIRRLIATVGNNPNVIRVIVGNEALYRKDISITQLISYLDEVRSRIVPPVSTAEPWYIWMRHPELAKHVDFLAVHMLPYWEGVGLDRAIQHIDDRMKDLKAAFPGKPIVIAEVGWPSHARTLGSAVASEANEAIFLRRFLARAQQQNYVYYVMEAFDQPWKRATEGDVGAYWGVYNVARQPKFAFSEPVVGIPAWRALAAISVVIAAVTLALVLLDSRTLRRRGRSFLAVITYSVSTAVVWIVYEYTQQYLTPMSIAVGIALLIGMIGVVVVLLAEAHEWAEALWVTERRRTFHPQRVPDATLPMVSIHVPAYNEPPELLIETLDALARLDYPRFEVLVIDNNTADPAVWQPVEAHCARLGARFRFFHVAPLAGFKAGALNFALAHTAPHAEIIAVIDSDYIVDRQWLRDLAPQFNDPRVAIVQAPQDYRDGRENAFKAMCYAEYRGFFYIGMVTRNERNAIIQHGTMTMVRRAALQEVGGWGEWCITEDAELGLRIFEQGYEAHYLPKSYGRGVMPDTFIDFKKQRFRWAFGAMQILRRHAASLFGRDGANLTLGQRYHFVAGWLPWLADGFNLVFNLAALAWSLGMIVAPNRIDPPLVAFSLLPLVLFGFKIAKLIYLYRTTVQATVGQTVAAALAGLALSHTIGLAMLSGMVRKDRPFFRTPKHAHAHGVVQAVAAAREETLLALALWVAGAGVFMAESRTGVDVLLWVAVLAIQSIPYLAALVVSLISAFPRLPAGRLGRKTADSTPEPEARSSELRS